MHRRRPRSTFAASVILLAVAFSAGCGTAGGSAAANAVPAIEAPPPFVASPPVEVRLGGGVITRAVRLRAIDGDGSESTASTVGIWQPTTNLVANGGVESDADGYGAVFGTETLERVTGDAKFGEAALRVRTPGSNADEGVYHAFEGRHETEYSASVWVRGSPGARVKLALFDDAGGSFARSELATLSGEWQRLTVTGVSAPEATVFRALLRTAEDVHPQATFFDIDGLQVERLAFPTPYVETSGGGGYALSSLRRNTEKQARCRRAPGGTRQERRSPRLLR